jgi:hypothetical protein
LIRARLCRTLLIVLWLVGTRAVFAAATATSPAARTSFAWLVRPRLLRITRLFASGLLSCLFSARWTLVRALLLWTSRTLALFSARLLVAARPI